MATKGKRNGAKTLRTASKVTKKPLCGVPAMREGNNPKQRLVAVSSDEASLAGDSAYSFVDLFAGAGGLSEGFRQAGFKALAGSDFDPDAMATYARNFPEAATVVGDIQTRSVRAKILRYAKAATVVIGGPPCQAFSQVRNHTRMIDDPRNSLYREFVSVIRDALPAAFVMENVTGIDQMGVREQITADLELNGEYCVLAQVVDAADFGVPQTRKRLLFIGVRNASGMKPPRLVGTGATTAFELKRLVTSKATRYELRLNKTLLTSGLSSALADSQDASIVSAEEAISDLTWLQPGNRSDELRYAQVPGPRSAYQRLMRLGADAVITNVQVPRIRSDTKLRLQNIPPGGNFRDLNESLLVRYLNGERWGQSNGTGKLSRQHFYAYRRLHGAIWAWTLNTKADSVYHYSAMRSLSVREFARLQSFPDRFTFTTDPSKGAIPGRHEGGAAHSKYRQVGNAVPPLLAKAAANALLKELQVSKARVWQHTRTA